MATFLVLSTNKNCLTNNFWDQKRLNSRWNTTTTETIMSNLKVLNFILTEDILVRNSQKLTPVHKKICHMHHMTIKEYCITVRSCVESKTIMHSARSILNTWSTLWNPSLTYLHNTHRYATKRFNRNYTYEHY